MDTNKLRNLQCHLKDEYGVESVRLLQTWEGIVKKMVDDHNHQRFASIKAGITPASCRLRNSFKTPKSYHIIHKAQRQLLYERVRNINQVLHLWELK